MGYRIAEHRDVMLPVNVCHDGNYLSFGATRVDLPPQSDVDAFLGKPNVNWHAALDPARPMAVDPLTGGAGGPGPRTFVKYRKGHCAGMQNALAVIAEAHADWARHTGRQHAPLVERYRMDGAEFALVTIGSMTGAGKDAIDEARDRGVPIGLVKVKTYRPFPDRSDRRRARRRARGGRRRPLGVVRLELRPAVPGRRGRARPRRQAGAVDELHRRTRGRGPHDRPLRRRRSSASGSWRRTADRARPCGSTRRTEMNFVGPASADAARDRSRTRRSGRGGRGTPPERGRRAGTEAMRQTDYLIIGASHAALSALHTLRMHDAEGAVTMVTRDAGLPYSPTVLPYVVSGRSAAERVFLTRRDLLPRAEGRLPARRGGGNRGRGTQRGAARRGRGDRVRQAAGRLRRAARHSADPGPRRGALPRAAHARRRAGAARRAAGDARRGGSRRRAHRHARRGESREGGRPRHHRRAGAARAARLLRRRGRGDDRAGVRRRRASGCTRGTQAVRVEPAATRLPDRRSTRRGAGLRPAGRRRRRRAGDRISSRAPGSTSIAACSSTTRCARAWPTSGRRATSRRRAASTAARRR